MVHAGADEQAVERQLDVVAARAAVADRDTQLLLDRRAVMEARVVVGPEEARRAEVAERVGERLPGRAQVVVVAGAVGLEPVAVVVVLELAQELEGGGWPHGATSGTVRRAGR
jgi:hypothetical protein